MRRPRTSPRPGATAVEFALVAPAVFLFVLALIVGGIGISRQQEVAHLAREGARFASTHGGKYTQDGMPAKTGVPAISSSGDLLNYLKTRTVLLNPGEIQLSVTWTAPASVIPSNMPSYLDPTPNQVPPGQRVIQNNVRVTVTYQWLPELYLVGPITLTSTSQMAMSY